MIFKNREDNFSFRQMRYGFLKAKPDLIKKDVTRAREQADILKSELELMHTEEEREVYLIKNFFVDYFQGYTRSIANRYLLGKFESVKFTYIRALRKYLFMILLPALILACLYFVYIYQVSLGSRSTQLWLSITMLAIFQEILLIQPFQIWLRWVLINGMVATEIRETMKDFRDRSRVILIRTSGLLRDSNALVQHYNPACRAARMFPELPVSRLLMTVSDFDIPSKPKRGYLGTCGRELLNY